MSENSGLAVYMMYQSLRLHFISDSYDYFKYNGKTNTTKESFLNNKNKYSFYKISRKYTLEDARDFFVANFLEGEVKWVGELLTDDAEDVYRKWQKRKQSLTYKFEQDIIELLTATQSPNEMLIVDNGQYPLLLNEVMRGKIAIETLVILNELMNFLPMWQKKIDDDIIWPEWQRKIKKYTPFVEYDKMKFKNIIRSLYEDAVS